MNTETTKKSIDDKFNNLEHKIDILSLEPIATDNKEQIHGYTVNQLLKKTYELNKEMPHAYIAGFFDGEGSVGAYVGKGYMRLMTHLGNTNFEILFKMKQMFGGGVYTRDKIENRMQIWDWDIRNRDELKNFLEKILPYSTVKRQQIKYALKYLELTTKSHSSNKISPAEHELRQFFSDKLKEMKHIKYTDAELKILNDKIKNINKDKNQHTMEDYQ